MIVKNKDIWLLDYCSKDKGLYITYNGIKSIRPNRFKVKIRKIIFITTVGVEKNYCKIVTKNRTFYHNDSMRNLIKKLDLKMLQISKTTYVVVSKLSKSLGESYVFLEHLEESPLRIGKSYAANVKRHLGYDN